jgi:hypothetical protein
VPSQKAELRSELSHARSSLGACRPKRVEDHLLPSLSICPSTSELETLESYTCSGGTLQAATREEEIALRVKVHAPHSLTSSWRSVLAARLP